MFRICKTLKATKWEVSLNFSTLSHPKVIHEVWEPKPLMECTDALNDLSYHTALTWKEILVQEAEAIDAWIPALEDRDREEVDNVDEETETEDE